MNWDHKTKFGINVADIGLINPITLRAAETGLTLFLKLFERKAFLGKYLMEKCWPEVKQQLSFKYLLNFRFIPKLFSKVRK